MVQSRADQVQLQAINWNKGNRLVFIFYTELGRIMYIENSRNTAYAYVKLIATTHTNINQVIITLT